MQTKFEQMEEMINSFPPSLDLLKKSLLSKLKEIQEEYVPRDTSISWGIEDFEASAENAFISYKEDNPNTKISDWRQMYDESKFLATLQAMIKSHDASNGINWDSINHSLKDCRINIGYDGPGIYSEEGFLNRAILEEGDSYSYYTDFEFPILYEQAYKSKFKKDE